MAEQQLSQEEFQLEPQQEQGFPGIPSLGPEPKKKTAAVPVDTDKKKGLPAPPSKEMQMFGGTTEMIAKQTKEALEAEPENFSWMSESFNSFKSMDTKYQDFAPDKRMKIEPYRSAFQVKNNQIKRHQKLIDGVVADVTEDIDIEGYIQKDVSGNEFLNKEKLRRLVVGKVSEKGGNNIVADYIYSKAARAAEDKFGLNKQKAVFDTKLKTANIPKPKDDKIVEQEFKDIQLNARGEMKNAQESVQMDFVSESNKVNDKYAYSINQALAAAPYSMNRAMEDARTQLLNENVDPTGQYQYFDNMMPTVSEEEVKQRAVEMFEQNNEDYLTTQYLPILGEMQAEIKSVSKKYNTILNRKRQEIQASYEQKFSQMKAMYDKDAKAYNDAIEKLWNDSGVEVQSDYERRMKETYDNMGLGETFGRKFTAAAGNMLYGIGAHLRSNGVTGSAVDFLSGVGQYAKYYNSTYTPSLKDAYLSPKYWAGGVGELLGSSSIIAATTIATRNPYIGAVISNLAEGSSMAGTAYEDQLMKGKDPIEASNAASNVAKMNMLTMPLNALQAKLFMPFTKGKGFTGAFKKLVAGSAGSTGEEVFQSTFEGGEGFKAEMAYAPDTLEMGLSVFGSSMLMGGISGAASSVIDNIGKNRKFPSPVAQVGGRMLRENGPSRMDAVAEALNVTGEIDDNQAQLMKAASATIIQSEQDATRIGLEGDKKDAYVGISYDIKQLEATKEQTQSSEGKSIIDRQIADKKQQLNDILDDKVELASVTIAGAKIVAPVEEVLKMMDADGFAESLNNQEVSVDSKNADILAKLDEIKQQQAPVRQRNIISDTGEVIGQVPAEAAPITEAAPAVQAEMPSADLVAQMTPEEKAQFSGDVVNAVAGFRAVTPGNEQGRRVIEAIQQAVGQNPASELDKAISSAEEDLNKAKASDTGGPISGAAVDAAQNKLDNLNQIKQKYATKISERAQQEGAQPSNIVQPEGTQEGQPQIREGERAVGQAAQPAADARNRDFGSQAQQIEATTKAIESIEEPKISEKLVPDSNVKQKVYHGSENKITGDFKNLNPNIVGFFFSTDIENAKTYGQEVVEAYVDVKNPLIIDAKGLRFTDDIPVNVIAEYPGEAPYETTIGLPIDEIANMVKNGKRPNQFIEIKDRQKYDGIIFKNIVDPALTSRRDVPQDTIVVFDNSQIKRGESSLISEAYVKAKSDGSNPELVKAVEDLIGQPAAAPMAEAAPVVEAAPVNVDELLTADTKVPTNLEKVFNFLDNIDNAIGRELNSGKLSDATRVIPLAAMQTIVKALKALVQGGMALQDAIKKVAADNNYQENDVVNAINTIATIENLAVSEGVTEAELPGFDRMMAEVQGIIDKSKQRGVDEAGMRENVMNYVQGSKVYEDATDVQREKLVREVNKIFGVRQPSAPRAGRLLGDIQDVKTITLTDKAALEKQIKDLARGAKDAITAWRNASSVLGKDIKEMARKGQITTKQAGNIIKKFGKVNILSPKSVGKFVDYMTKVFADAEYENKLSTGKSVRKDISKLSKNKEKDANLREVAKSFLDIDPSMVEDIDAYNDMANKIKESLAGSKARKAEVSFASTVNIDDASNYIKEAIASQDQKLRAETAAEIQELMGIDVSDFSYDDMIALLEKGEPISKDNESIIRATINKAFSIYSSVIKKALANNVDPFTDAPFEVSESQKDLINRFMGMDLNRLTPKEALQAVDALNNFIQNKSTAKMESVVADYTGKLNAKKVKEKGVVSTALSKYFSKGLGRVFAEQLTNLGPLFERMFKGVARGGFVEDMSGLSKVRRGKAAAESASNKIAKEYVDLFYKQKANGEEFNSVKNMVERGMIAFVSRNVIGTQAERGAEFNRRKNIIKESIDALSVGSEKEKQKAKEYKEIYDKLGVESATNAQEISKNADPLNVEAVNWWTDKWSEVYPQLSDLSQNVYNRILDKDTDYNPDRFKVLTGVSELADLTNEESAFHYNTGTVYKKETGVLMKATRPETLPKGKNNKPSRYIDLSFDNNNANSMYDALIDINTAAAIRQVDAFFNSEDFNDIVPSAEDRGVLERRVSLYVRKIRNKAPFENDELSKGIKRLQNLAAVGVGQALGGVTQPFKQVIPVIANTIVNAGRLDIGALLDKNKNDFINRSGYSIANRGVESQAQIDSINRIIEISANSTPKKALRVIEKTNKMWLDIFLVKPDAWVARSSWITYYEESLKKQGIDPSTIDWATHEVNEEAGNYAQRMIDRQQNVSDPSETGKLLADSDNSFKNLIVKMAMPFASFRLNQSVRIANDISTLSNTSTSIKEDKITAARSLAGYAVETTIFRGMSIGIAILIGNAAKYLMGDDEDEKEKQKRIDNLIKGQATSTATELLSPVPVLDKVAQEGLYTLTDEVQNAMDISDKDKINIYKPKPDEFLKSLGLLGITAERAAQFYELTDLSAFDGEFEDNYGKMRELKDKDKEILRTMIGPALASSLGILPTEVNSIIRFSLKDAKKRATLVGGKKGNDRLRKRTTRKRNRGR